MALPSPWLDATARVRRGDSWILFYPWHQKPDPRPDMERIGEGYAADSVESWFPIDDHHWYFTRDDLGRLFQETTSIRGDLYMRKTHELRQWLARALDDGEVRAYRWDEPQPDISGFGEPPVTVAYVPRPLPPVEEAPEKCEYCGNAKHLKHGGAYGHVGDSGALGSNIFNGKWDRSMHRWYSESGSLAAHHLICCESVNNEQWAKYCRDHDYNINRKENGVMLPTKMQAACQIHIPLHVSNHDAGKGDNGASYPASVFKELDAIALRLESGTYCNRPGGLTEAMDQLSIKIIVKLNKFVWTLTKDGKDYMAGGVGCAGVTSLTGKPVGVPCPDKREHGVSCTATGAEIKKFTGNLEVGT